MDWTTIIVAAIGAIASIVTAFISKQNSKKTESSNKDIKKLDEKVESLSCKIDSLSGRTDLQDAALKEIIGNFIDKAFTRWKSNNGIAEKEFGVLTENYSIYKQLHGNHDRDDEFRIISDDVKINGFLDNTK